MALGDNVSNAHPMVDTLADLRKQWSTRWLSRKQRWRQTRYATHSDAQATVDNLADLRKH